MKLGRFISRDLIEYGGEDMNLFRYVENCSGNWTDPYGNS
jgi:RHS repeat-associated protein